MDVPFGLVITLILLIILNLCDCSTGDMSNVFRDCWLKCQNLNCTNDHNTDFIPSIKQPLHLKILGWTCDEECKRECMWTTIDMFHKNNWSTPQFFGKWPFIRILGMQEPASAIFSMYNFYMHFKSLMTFRKEVRHDSPLYWLWHAFAGVCLNAWIWSTVFHVRDTLFTEFMDYACAFSIIVMSCYLMCFRVLYDFAPRFILVVLTTFMLAFFYNHCIYLYLYMGRFDYGYNMKLNVLVGTSTGLCWFVWCTLKRSKQSYVGYCAMFVALSGMALLLEACDSAPLWYILDCHAGWHFSTAILIILKYRFAIEDCKYLRKQLTIEQPVKKRP